MKHLFIQPENGLGIVIETNHFRGFAYPTLKTGRWAYAIEEITEQVLPLDLVSSISEAIEAIQRELGSDEAGKLFFPFPTELPDEARIQYIGALLTQRLMDREVNGHKLNIEWDKAEGVMGQIEDQLESMDKMMTAARKMGGEVYLGLYDKLKDILDLIETAGNDLDRAIDPN